MARPETASALNIASRWTVLIRDKLITIRSARPVIYLLREASRPPARQAAPEAISKEGHRRNHRHRPRCQGVVLPYCRLREELRRPGKSGGICHRFLIILNVMAETSMQAVPTITRDRHGSFFSARSTRDYPPSSMRTTTPCARGIPKRIHSGPTPKTAPPKLTLNPKALTISNANQANRFSLNGEHPSYT
ncbi:MAG: hypothetical protein JWL59_174 [Chthoniobacteraceae bacterium]|nr:hypothetical protein [Chthoniobacteraceae bacterium]